MSALLMLLVVVFFGFGSARGQEPQRAEIPFLPELDDSMGVEEFEVNPWVPPDIVAADMGRLTGDSIEYDRENRVLTARDNARLEFRDKIITARMIQMDREADKAICSGDVKFDSERLALRASQVVFDFKADTMDARGKVVYQRRRKAPTRDELMNPPDSRRGRLSAALKRRDSVVSCVGFNHNWETGDFTALGPVRIKADEYELEAGKIIYDGESGQGDIEGPVVFKLLKGQWLIDEGVVEDDDTLAKALVMHYTVLRCRRAVYNDQENTFKAMGSVMINQEGRSLSAGRLELDEEAGLLLVTGDVELFQENGEWLFDGEVITEDDDEVVRALAREQTKVNCGSLRVEYRDDKYLLEDAVLIEQPDKLLTADRMEIDDDREWIEMLGSVTLYQSSGQWMFDADIIEEDDDEVLRALAKPETRITCGRLAGYYTEGDQRILLERTVRVEQPDKALNADEMLVLDTEEEQQLVVKGGVNAHQNDGQWIFDNDLLDEEDADEDLKEALKDEATLTGEYLQFDFERGEHLAIGDVRIQQKEHELEAEAIYYRSDEKLIGVQGDVRAHKRDTGEWIYSDEVRYDDAGDIIEAWGNVEARIEIDSEEEEAKQ